MASVWSLDAARYTRHELHGEAQVWVEKNCYIDVWIEALHAARLEPLALLAFTLASDFDDDQWTFYKPAHADISRLYGVGVQELNVYKPILEHALTHVEKGRLVMTEADSFWLPDTRGTDYRAHHVKTTIAIESIDLAAERLGYFHNAGYYALEGEDFRELFRLGKPADPQFLPLFAELVKYDRVERLDTPELARRSRENLSFWYARRPTENPFQRFTPVFARVIEELKTRDVAEYHAYAFATIRQFGSCFDLTAQYLRWLGAALPGSIGSAAPHFEAISNSAKAMILKGARAVVGRKAVDFAPMLSDMARAWDDGVTALGSSLAE